MVRHECHQAHRMIWGRIVCAGRLFIMTGFFFACDAVVGSPIAFAFPAADALLYQPLVAAQPLSLSQ